MNPHKWKKYSLDDADISDRTNTSAAFAFLAEIEKRKDVEEEKRSQEHQMDVDDSPSGKIVFKKQNSSKEYRKPSFNQSVPLRKEMERRETNEETGEKAVLKGSKVVMPEYVIGQKIQKQNKRKVNTESTADSKKSGKSGPTLQHLFDEEEEDED